MTAARCRVERQAGATCTCENVTIIHSASAISSTYNVTIFRGGKRRRDAQWCSILLGGEQSEMDLKATALHELERDCARKMNGMM